MREIVEGIRQRVDEETTSANIAYLPGGFVPVHKAFTAMAKVKKTWGINVLDKESDYHLHVEDKLKITVPKKHLHTFKQESGINDFGAKEIDLSKYTVESVHEAQNDQAYNTELINQIEDALYESLAKSPIIVMEEDLDAWSVKFPGRYLPVRKAFMNSNSMHDDIQDGMHMIDLKVSEDRGELELILDSLKKQQNMSRYDVFNSYQYVWAGVVESFYRGTKLIFECLADQSFGMTERIYVNNRDVLDELKGTTLVKIGKGVIYPSGGRFQQNFFITLKNAIDGQ